MEMSESIKNISKAFVEFQKEIENPKNTAENPFFKSKYTPLPEVINHAKPILAKHGLSVIQDSHGEDGEKISITTMLLHETGEWIKFNPLTLRTEKITPQGAGIAITYGRRYALSSALGIASEDDDDGNGLEENGNGNQGQQNGNKGTGKQPRKLTENQVKRLYAIANKNGWSKEHIKNSIKKVYGKEEVENLTKTEYDNLVNGIENNPKN